jgi:hypothetical protein
LTAARRATSHSPTTAQLRHDIDSGRTGDKVAGFDPAAAPLGTDEEAAGTPPSVDAIALARRLEAYRPETWEHRETGHVWFIGGIVAVALLIVMAMVALR